MYHPNSMNRRYFGRTQQMWLLLVACIGLFAGFLWFIPQMTWSLWWKAMLAGLGASLSCIFIFSLWFRRVLVRREGIIKLIDRVTSGDLSLNARDIIDETQSTKMANAMRALVATLERTIRRFGQLAADVSKASAQISNRSRILARSSIDQSINSVRRSMEDLSANAEETSTSILEMSTSIEEVSRIADTLSEFVEQTSSAIEEMITSINEVATNTESFSSFATPTASSDRKS